MSKSADDELRRNRAVPAVLLQAQAMSCRAPSSRRSSWDRARRRSPSRRRVRLADPEAQALAVADGTGLHGCTPDEQGDVRVAGAEGRQTLELGGEPERGRARTIASIPAVRGRPRRGRCQRGAAKAAANASSSPGAIESPAAARWPPKRCRCCAQAPSAPCRSKAAAERPEPSSCAGAAGDQDDRPLKRSTSLEATIPITPSCQSSPQIT